VERSGRPLTADDLRGHVWIASFIFTRCGGTCPAISTTMASFLRRVPDPSLRAVSFTVDPRRDDPGKQRRTDRRFRR